MNYCSCILNYNQMNVFKFEKILYSLKYFTKLACMSTL